MTAENCRTTVRPRNIDVVCPAVLINWSQVFAVCQFITLTIVLSMIFVASAIATVYIFTNLLHDGRKLPNDCPTTQHRKTRQKMQWRRYNKTTLVKWPGWKILPCLG